MKPSNPVALCQIHQMVKMALSTQLCIYLFLFLYFHSIYTILHKMFHSLNISPSYGLKIQPRHLSHSVLQWILRVSSVELRLYQTPTKLLNWKKERMYGLKFCTFLFSEPVQHQWFPQIWLLSCDRPCLAWTRVAAGFLWSCIWRLGITLPNSSINWGHRKINSYILAAC